MLYEVITLNMSRRLPGCRALRTFVVAVLVLQQTGGNLIEIISRLAEQVWARDISRLEDHRAVALVPADRITSYNVCYTKLLRSTC